MRIWRTIIHPVFEKPEYSLDNLYFTNHSSIPRNDKNKRGYSYAPRLGVSNSVTAGTTASSRSVCSTALRKQFELLLVSDTQVLLLYHPVLARASPAPVATGPIQQGTLAPWLPKAALPTTTLGPVRRRQLGHADSDDSTLLLFQHTSSNHYVSFHPAVCQH